MLGAYSDHVTYASSILSCCSNVVCEIKSFNVKLSHTQDISLVHSLHTTFTLGFEPSVLEIYFIRFVLANN